MQMRPLPMMIALAASGWAEPSISQSTAPVEMTLVALEDSSRYLVYRYDIVLPTGSSGVGALALDVASPYGAREEILAATGELNDFTRFGGAPVTNAVEFGPISAGNWGALLPGDGTLIWTGVNNSWLSVDSIASGATLAGVGLRSSFLPGVREVAAWPTRQACCNEPWGTAAQNPDRAHRDPDYFAVSSYTVGPKYRSDQLTLTEVIAELTTICANTDWIDSALCSEFENFTARAGAALQRGNASEVTTAMARLSTRLDEQQAVLHPNAFWILKLNAVQVGENAVASR